MFDRLLREHPGRLTAGAFVAGFALIATFHPFLAATGAVTVGLGVAVPFARSILVGRRWDAMARSLALAPLDDEPPPADIDLVLARAEQEIRSGRLIPAARLLARRDAT